MLENRVAVITGSSQGLGRAFALALAKAGAKVVVNARTAVDVDKVVDEIGQLGGAAVATYDSVATFEGAGRIVQTAVDHFGGIDILINNAGTRVVGSIYDISEQDWDELLSVHLKGTFNCSRHASPIMKDRRYGRIINIFSLAIFNPFPSRCAYHAAKGGIWALTGAMAQELGPFGITVNAVSPGFTETRMTAELVAQSRSADGITVPGLQWIPPLIQPEEVAPLVVYLCTDGAAQVNGQTFFANGREIAWYPLPTAAKSAYTTQDMWSVEELIRIFPLAFDGAVKA